MMASILPKWRATSRAVVSPTWRMPSANSRRPSAGARALSIASTGLSADFWPMRSRPTSSSGRRLYRSASDFTRPLSTSWSTSFSPSPSISSALRLAACHSVCLRCAPQNRPPVQRAMVSSSSRSMAEPQTGQAVGMTNSRASAGRFPAPRRPPRESRRRRGARSPCRRCVHPAPDFVFVVQRRVGDGDAAHEHRLEPSDGRDGARAPHLHLDVKQGRGGLFGRELVRQRGAARAPKPSSFCAASESTL